MLRDYPNIYQYFSKEWIEKELKKYPESQHPLIAKIRFNDNYTKDFLYFLNDCLECLKGELREVGSYKKRLKQNFWSTFAEIEVATFFKKMGFTITMQPKLNSGKSSDVLLHYQDYYVYIEVTMKEPPEERPLKNIPKKFRNCNYFELPNVKSETYADKIDQEIDQLSDDYPNILCMYLDPSLVSQKKARQLALYDGIIYSAHGYPYHTIQGLSKFQMADKISAFFEFSNFYFNGYHLHNLMYLNPNPKNPIPDDIVMLFQQNGVNIADNPLILSSD
jgi:hypothetical protein